MLHCRILLHADKFIVVFAVFSVMDGMRKTQLLVGLLAQGELASALVSFHVARQALRLTPVTTIYTLGNEQLANDIKAMSSMPEIKVDSQAIKKLTKDPEGAKVTLRFEYGTSYTEGFISHKPQFKLKGPFAEHLGLDKTSQETVNVDPPFYQTSVKGCFAAGAAANIFQTVTQALASGTASGGGALFQLQAETFGQKGFL
jgi:thioredoxin reductase